MIVLGGASYGYVHFREVCKNYSRGELNCSLYVKGHRHSIWYFIHVPIAMFISLHEISCSKGISSPVGTRGHATFHAPY